MISSIDLYPNRCLTAEHTLLLEKILVLLEHSNIVEFQQKQQALALVEPVVRVVRFGGE